MVLAVRVYILVDGQQRAHRNIFSRLPIQSVASVSPFLAEDVDTV